jgi:hypothetical protein
VSRNDNFFVRANDAHGAAGVHRADNLARFVVEGAVQSNAETIEAAADALSNDGRIFADASGENERVKTTESSDERSDGFACLVAKHVEGERGVLVVHAMAWIFAGK